MTYEDIYKGKTEKGDFQSLTPTFYEWKERGQHLVGKYVTKMVIESNRNSATYYQYILDTDIGRVKFACGKVTDQAIADILEPGAVYAFEYNGKVPLVGGREVNDFKVLLLEHPDQPRDGDLPF